MIRIAILIPTKSLPEWKNIESTFLFKHFLDSFKQTYSKQYNYTIYLGYDHDDHIFTDESQVSQLKKRVSSIENVNLKLYKFRENQFEKGDVVGMWNFLCEEAYNNEMNDYFIQLGDDIYFNKRGWVENCINLLQKNGNLGMTGPVNINGEQTILTQSMVSRKHYDIFGFYYPSEFKNWFSDTWMNKIYEPEYVYKDKEYTCINLGGNPRYEPDRVWHYSKNKDFNEIVERDRKKIHNFIICLNKE